MATKDGEHEPLLNVGEVLAKANGGDFRKLITAHIEPASRAESETEEVEEEAETEAGLSHTDTPAETEAETIQEETEEAVLPDGHHEEGAEEPEADAEAEPEKEDSETETDLKGLPEWAITRIGKYTARAKAAEEKAAAAVKRAEEAEARARDAEDKNPRQVAFDPGSPLANIFTAQDLNKQVDVAWKMKRWADEHPDGDTVEEGGKSKDYSAEDIRRIRLHAEEIIHHHAPARKEFLAQRAQHNAAAVKQYPWLNDKTSPEYQLAAEAYRIAPWLGQVPDGTMFVAQWVRGYQAEQAELQAKSKPKPKATIPAAKPKTQPSTPGAAPAKPKGPEAQAQEARKQFFSNPRDRDARRSFIKGALNQ